MSSRANRPPSANKPRTALEARAWSGPLPSPEDLQKFDQVIHGGAYQIFLMAKEEQAHRQSIERETLELERAAVQANIAAQDKDFTIAARGHYLGFAVSILALGASVGSVALGAHWSVSVALVGVPIMSAVRAIVLRK